MIVIALIGGCFSAGPKGIEIDTDGLLQFMQKAAKEKGIALAAMDFPGGLARTIMRVPSSRVLWVDDKLLDNLFERQALGQLGIFVDSYTTNADALVAMRAARYDIVISDIARPQGQEDGLALLQHVRAQHPAIPVFFYTRKVDGPVQGAAGITNDPEVLIEQVARLAGLRK